MAGPALYAALLVERPMLARSFLFFTGGSPANLPDEVPVLAKPVDEPTLRSALLRARGSGMDADVRAAIALPDRNHSLPETGSGIGEAVDPTARAPHVSEEGP